ncbi:hypothetical protein PTI98_012932, partial [Pleurotus ostreatus]
ISMPSLSLHGAFASFFVVDDCKVDGPWRFKGFQRLTGMTSLSPEDPPLGWSAREIELIRAYLTEYSMQEEKYRMSFTRKKLISSANGRQLWGRLIQQISDKIGLPALISQSMEEGGVNPFMVQSQTGTWPQAKQSFWGMKRFQWV